MKKRWTISLIIVLSLTLVITACSSSNSNVQEPANGSEEPSNSNTAEETPQFPLKEKITVTIAAPQTPVITDMATNNVTKLLEEKTNIQVEWKLIPEDKKKESLNLMLASGDYPDAFLGLDIGDDLEAQYGVDQQIFMPLNDLIDGNMPNFQGVLERYPDVEGRITATDGKIYLLPSLNECYHCTFQQRMWINQEWLDNLGLEMPATTEEFYTVLKAFKEQDPNRNGKADEIALMASAPGWNTDLSFLVSSFIMDPGQYSKIKFIVKEEKLIPVEMQPEYKEALVYLSKLYKEGLIYEGSFTQTHEQSKQLLANAEGTIVGAFASGASVIDIDLNSNLDTYKKFTVLPPLKNPSGTVFTPHYYDITNAGEFAISSSSKYAKELAMWADQFYDYTMQDTTHFGMEGTGWRSANADEKGLDGQASRMTPLIPFISEPQNDAWAHLGIEYMPADYRNTQTVPQTDDLYQPDASEKLLLEETKNKMEPNKSDTIKIGPPIKLTSEENQELSTIRVELEKYLEEFRIKAIMDGSVIEKEWDSYIGNLENIGYPTFLEIYQAAYDRQYAK